MAFKKISLIRCVFIDVQCIAVRLVLLNYPYVVLVAMAKQLAEFPRSEFDRELISHKSAVFNILQQNVTIFDIGNG